MAIDHQDYCTCSRQTALRAHTLSFADQVDKFATEVMGQQVPLPTCGTMFDR